jgi:nucleoside-diphosphate-sugar epimerase
MKVLVTGAAGKIGRGLAAELLEHNIDVVGFDAASRPEGLDCPWFSGDLSDASLDDAMNGCDTVIHLAAIPKHIDGLEYDTCRVNFLGAVRVLDYAVRHEVSRVVAASSICASGLITGVGSLRPQSLPITEEFNGGPDDMYGMSKRFGEYLADAYQRRYGLHMINLRVASVAFLNDP